MRVHKFAYSFVIFFYSTFQYPCFGFVFLYPLFKFRSGSVFLPFYPFIRIFSSNETPFVNVESIHSNHDCITCSAGEPSSGAPVALW